MVFLHIAFSCKSSCGEIDVSERMLFTNIDIIKSIQQATSIGGYQINYLFVAQV